MTLKSWTNRCLTSLTRKLSSLSAKKSPRAHLVLECLEERAVPAAFNVVLPNPVTDPGSFGIEMTRMTLNGFGKVGDFNLTGGYKPQLIAAGDFNGDGKRDLVVTNGNNSYSVLLSDGNGNFTAQAPVALQGPGTDSTEGIVVFAANGKLDLAIASYGNGVSQGAVTILLGNGDGTFTQGQSLSLPTGKNGGARPTYVTTYTEETGKLDLVVSDFQNDKVLIYQGQGNGNFDFHDYVESNDTNKLSGPNQLVVADFNGDGIPHAAVANKNNGSGRILKASG